MKKKTDIQLASHDACTGLRGKEIERKNITRNIEMELNELQEILHVKYPELNAIPIKWSDIVFEERVKQKCFHCANYHTKWTCPGHLPVIDYKELVREYEHAAVIICKMPLEQGTVDEDVRYKSTNMVHRAMLYLEGELYKRNNTLAISYIGGSCKLCKNGCNPDRCANPGLSRVPWEATGCNVVSTLKNIGIDVVFPPTDSLYRYGLFLW